MLEVGKESYITVVEADTYIARHYRSNNPDRKRWEALSEEDKEVLLLGACTAIEQLPFGGRKTTEGQVLSFPRLPYQYGQAQVPPDNVLYAQAELALSRSDDVRQATSKKRKNLQADGVTSFSVGDLSENYGDASSMTQTPLTEIKLYPAVHALLKMYLSGSYQIL